MYFSPIGFIHATVSWHQRCRPCSVPVDFNCITLRQKLNNAAVKLQQQNGIQPLLILPVCTLPVPWTRLMIQRVRRQATPRYNLFSKTQANNKLWGSYIFQTNEQHAEAWNQAKILGEVAGDNGGVGAQRSPFTLYPQMKSPRGDRDELR